MADNKSATSPVKKPERATYNGGCHCGRVKYSMNISPPIYDGPVTSCNCSICLTNGYLMVYPLESQITWHSGYDDMTTYTFGKERVKHSFCSICGTSICAMSNDPAFFPDNRAMNVRTVEGIDVDKLKLRKVDGRSM